MKNINIKINSKNSMVYPDNDIVGINYENLQGNIICYFEGKFINGIAWLEIKTPDGTTGYIAMEKVGETYVLPIKSSLLAQPGFINMQLRITQQEDINGIPIFKSNIFYLKVKEAINSTSEIPDEYSTWIDIANTKILEIENLNVTGNRIENGVEIIFTNKQGEKTTMQIYDGEKGSNAQYTAGENIKIQGNVISAIIPNTERELEELNKNLSKYALSDKVGATINLTYDTITHELKSSLINSKGTILNEKSISLPLESMVVSGSYDNTNKKIIMTLQNGNKVEVAVGDLIDGLVSQQIFDNAIDTIESNLNLKFDKPYYFEYDTSNSNYETQDKNILEMFNEIKDAMENDQHPCLIIRKGSTGANALQTYHFVIPQFGTLDTAYIILKSSPIRKIDNTFDVVALNCERNADTGLITKVYEKKEDSILKVGDYKTFILSENSTDNETISIMQKVYDLWRDGIMANLTYTVNDLVFTFFDVDKYSNHIDFYMRNGGIGSTKYGIGYYSFDRYNIKCYYDNNTITSVVIEEMADMFNLHNDAEILGMYNTTEFMPEHPYQPATKKYVDNSNSIYFANVEASNDNWCTKQNLTPILQEAYNKGYNDIMIRTVTNGARFLTCKGGDLQQLAQGKEIDLMFVNLQHLTGSTVTPNRMYIGYSYAYGVTLDNNNNITINGDVGTMLANNNYVDLMKLDGLSEYAGYDASKTQVLKNINGVFTWVNE